MQKSYVMNILGGGALLAAGGIMVSGQRLPSRQKTATSSPTVDDAEGDDALAVHSCTAIILPPERNRILADLFFFLCQTQFVLRYLNIVIGLMFPHTAEN